MSGFFIVKGELAAWALGLEESDTLTGDEQALLVGHVEVPAPKRRKRRLGHEAYRLPPLRRRQLVER